MKTRNNNKKAGFTLIELLVVIAIIAILASLLLPAMSRGKEGAGRTACQSKIRQWVLAERMYAEEYEEFLPREKGSPSNQTWGDVTAPTNADVWYNSLPFYLNQKALSLYATDVASFHSGASFFQCPSARFPSSNPGPVFSLVVNSKLNQSKDVLSQAKLCWIQDEATTVLFLDAGVPGETWPFSTPNKYEWGLSSAWVNRLSGRHQAGANLGFADGHVQWFRLPRLYDPATGTNNTSNGEVRWTIPP